ncbi:unnamed protein product, partial [Rotaria sp. Silwood2]
VVVPDAAIVDNVAVVDVEEDVEAVASDTTVVDNITVPGVDEDVDVVV